MKRILFVLFISFLSSGLLLAQQTDEQLATQYFTNHEYGKAAGMYEQLINRNPSSVYIYDNLLLCYFNLEQFDQAEKLVKKQQRRFGENAFYKVDLGYVYNKSGKGDKATKYYEDLFKNFKGTDQQTTDLANAFQKRNEKDWAVQTYLRSRKINGNPTLYAIPLAQLYASHRNTAKVVEEYLNALENNEQWLNEVEEFLQLYLETPADFDILKTAVLKKEKEHQSNTYPELLIWLYVQRRDYNNAFIQGKALDKRNKENGRRLLELAEMAMSNGSYDAALNIYQYIIQLGKDKPLFINAQMGSLEAKNKRIFSGENVNEAEIISLKTDYENFLTQEGRNDFTASTIRELARLNVFYLHNDEAGIRLFRELIDMPRLNSRIKAECKLELGDIYVLRNEVWEAVLLYGQVDKEFLEDPLGQEAKFRNAKLSYYIGEFEWARAQLDVLKTATSQLISNDALELSLLIQDNTQDSNEAPLLQFARADLLYFQNRIDDALRVLDSLQLVYPRSTLDDEILYKKAQLFVKKNDIPRSIGLLEQLLKENGSGVLGDNALYLMADLTEHRLHDVAKAQALYEKFIVDYPGSFFLPDIRKRFRALRGDHLE